MRLLFCLAFLFTFSPLPGQGAMYLPEDLARLFPDSLVSPLTLQKWDQNLASIGQLNDRCTASIVSSNGLLLSNYHCLSGLIRNPEHRAQGFIAKQAQDEVPLPDLQFKLEIFREKVTDRILKGIQSNTPEKERAAIINRNSLSIILEQQLPNDQQAYIKSHHQGGEFYLIIQKVFRDVRLVLLPSKLTPDTSLYPLLGGIRNLHDFAFLRIYTNQEEQGVAFNTTNQAYQAKNYASLGTQTIDVHNKAFFLHTGYPGSTQFHLSSKHLALNAIQRLKTELKTDSAALIIYQANAPEARVIPYLLADIQQKKNQLSLFKNRQILEKKEKAEIRLLSNPNANTYQAALQKLHQELAAQEYLINAKYISDYAFTHESLFQQSKYLSVFIKMSKDKGMDAVRRRKAAIIHYLKSLKKKESQLCQQLILATALDQYFNSLKSQDLSPMAVEQVRAVNKDYQLLAEIFYKESLLNDIPKQIKLVEKDVEKWVKSLEKDIAYRFYDQLLLFNKNKITLPFNSTQKKLQNLQRVLIQEQIKITPPPFPVVANGSLRLSPGNSLTLINNPILKEDVRPWFYEINFQCSKGSSGGPVFDQEGKLISIHVSRSKDSQLSDYFFDPLVDRSLSLSTVRIFKYLTSKQDAVWIHQEIDWN